MSMSIAEKCRRIKELQDEIAELEANMSKRYRVTVEFEGIRADNEHDAIRTVMDLLHEHGALSAFPARGVKATILY